MVKYINYINSNNYQNSSAITVSPVGSSRKQPKTRNQFSVFSGLLPPRFENWKTELLDGENYEQ